METTLNKIKAHNPCTEGWKKILDYVGKDAPDDDPIKVTPEKVNVIGIKDAVWGLRAVEGHDKEIRLFACACARLALPTFEKEYPDDNRPRRAIETAERYANGEVGKSELKTATRAAWAAEAAADAAWAATRAAAWAAAEAAWAAAAEAAADAARAADAASWAASRAAAATATATTAWGQIENIFCGIFCGVDK